MQAKRCSVGGATGNARNGDDNPIHVTGTSLELLAPEPNREEPLNELAKKRTLGLTLPQKIQEVIKPIVEARDTIPEAVHNQSNEETALKLSGSVPAVTPKCMNGPAMVQLTLDLHSTLKV